MRAQPEVAAASGSICDLGGNSDQPKLIDRDGKPLGTSKGGPTSASDSTRGTSTSIPSMLTTGRWASGRGEVVIDNESAAKEHFGVGDPIRVAANGPAGPFHVIGIASFGDVDSLGGATFAVFDVPTAQRCSASVAATTRSSSRRDRTGSPRSS